jgi:hypothetical protein
MDWVHGSWTSGARGSTVDQSGTSTEVTVAHGRHTTRQARGLAGGEGKGEQGRARPGDGSSRRNPQWGQRPRRRRLHEGGGASAWEERKARGKVWGMTVRGGALL